MLPTRASNPPPRSHVGGNQRPGLERSPTRHLCPDQPRLTRRTHLRRSVNALVTRAPRSRLSITRHGKSRHFCNEMTLYTPLDGAAQDDEAGAQIESLLSTGPVLRSQQRLPGDGLASYLHPITDAASLPQLAPHLSLRYPESFHVASLSYAAISSSVPSVRIVFGARNHNSGPGGPSLPPRPPFSLHLIELS